MAHLASQLEKVQAGGPIRPLATTLARIGGNNSNLSNCGDRTDCDPIALNVNDGFNNLNGELIPDPTTGNIMLKRTSVYAMQFTKRLREGIRRGRIKCSVRIWTSPRVKVGNRYRMDDGHIVVDSVTPIAIDDITYDLARESGFESVEDLLAIARHGRGENGYLIRFHYLPPGGWDVPSGGGRDRSIR